MGDYPGSPSHLTCHHKCPCTKGRGGGQGTPEQDAVLWVLQTRMWPGAGQLLKPWEWDPRAQSAPRVRPMRLASGSGLQNREGTCVVGGHWWCQSGLGHFLGNHLVSRTTQSPTRSSGDTRRPRSTGITTACVSATVRVTVMGEGLLTRWKVP